MMRFRWKGGMKRFMNETRTLTNAFKNYSTEGAPSHGRWCACHLRNALQTPPSEIRGMRPSTPRTIVVSLDVSLEDQAQNPAPLRASRPRGLPSTDSVLIASASPVGKARQGQLQGAGSQHMWGVCPLLLGESTQPAAPNRTDVVTTLKHQTHNEV